MRLGAILIAAINVVGIAQAAGTITFSGTLTSGSSSSTCTYSQISEDGTGNWIVACGSGSKSITAQPVVIGGSCSRYDAMSEDVGGNWTITNCVSIAPAEVFYIHPDHLGTPRVITQATDNKVRWVWENNEPFGTNSLNENPQAVGQFVYNLRFPGQYYDIETGTHYNMARDYHPGIGRYTQSDPVGLGARSQNTYAYVSGNPVGLIDPMGLFQVISRGFPQQEAVLAEQGQRMQARINKLCKQARDKLQPIFDRWIVSVDPNLRNLVRRNTGDYAQTDYWNKSTEFYVGFFSLHSYLRSGDAPSQGSVMAHEFRHLMPENYGLYPGDATYIRARILGTASQLDIEKDADFFSSSFIQGLCSCAD